MVTANYLDVGVGTGYFLYRCIVFFKIKIETKI